MTGPLQGVRVVEFSGIGPGPYAAMLLADLGADVVRVDRPGSAELSADTLGRGKRSVQLDLKDPADREVALRLAAWADVLVEGFRPGVMERLGLGPADCHAVNPALVYGRMTGWGQEGPLADIAGHDIDYVAVTGTLWALGRDDEVPAPPLNLVGDFGGGSLFLVTGVLAALLAARQSGEGDIVDAAIVDGVASLSTMVRGLRVRGLWQDRRGANLLDGGAPFYEVYRCADGGYVAVGAIEPQFYAELVARTGCPLDPAAQYDVAQWPEQRRTWAELFAGRPRDAWVELVAGSHACLAPVLDWEEAEQHPHLRARGTFVDVGGVPEPAPAPRFTRTMPATPTPAPTVGAHTEEVLRMLGLQR